MFFEINNQSKIRIKINETLIRKLISRATEMLNIPPKKKISVAMVSGQRIRELNKKYRHLDKATSILSFPAGVKNFVSPKSEGNFIGEIIMVPEIILQQAKKKKISFNKEFSLIFVHGLLHILGFSHRKEKEAKKMNVWEDKIISQLGNFK